MTDFSMNEIFDGLSEKEKQLALSILSDYSKDGKSETFDTMRFNDYEEIPVDIDTFLHNPTYLGSSLVDNEGRFSVYPYWVDTLHKIFPNNTDTDYHTLALTGSIGIGKSFIAVICGLYMLYRMICLKDPYIHYGLQPIDDITFAFINITLDAAQSVAWKKCQDLLQQSPWFMSKGTVSGQKDLVWNPPKGISLIAGSQPRHIIGRALFFGFVDEISFRIGQDVSKQVKQATEIVSSADARMQSRFMNGTYNPTLLVVASSKRTEQSYMETFIANKKKNESKSTLIVDEPQWVIRTDKDSKKKFKVAVGNKFLDSEVVPLDADEAELQLYRDRGYKLIDVPIGYYENFIDDLNIALTDIAGISTSNTSRYLSGQRIAEAKTAKRKNLFVKEIIQVGDGKDDKTQYSDFIDVTRIDPIMKSRPLYIHLDMSLSGDKTGIAGTCIMGKVPHTEDSKSESKELYYAQLFHVSVKATKGHQVSFEKNRQLVYWFRENGFNVKGVSFDTYQSADLGQNLSARGFKTEVISVDRIDAQQKVCLPYLTLKNAIYEGRLEMYESTHLTDELIGLEKDANGKVDHSPSGINSKDAADALCGSLYNASQHAAEFAFEYGETLTNIVSVNNNGNTNIDKQQLNVDFEEELRKISLNRNNLKQPSQQDSFMDFGLGKATSNFSSRAYVLDGIII